MSERAHVIYVTSMGRSGSTLLDLLLSAHSKVFSVGEIIYLDDYAHVRRSKGGIHRFGSECTCGAETIWECPFWTEVEAWLQRNHNLSLRDFDLRAHDNRLFKRNNSLLFEGVRLVSGKQYIVDSSKSARRFARLRRCNVAHMHPVHLFRDPKGQVYSNIRKRNLSRYRGTVPYTLLTALKIAHRRLILTRSTPHVVRYEQMVADTQTMLEELMQAMGLEYEPQQLQWAGLERHNIGGNQMRRTTDSTIKLDEKWKNEMPVDQRILVDVLTKPVTMGL